MAAEDESRAKRLKLLREAKERKEQQQNGEYAKPHDAPVPTSSSSSQEKQNSEVVDQQKSAEASDAIMTSETQEKEDEDDESELMHLAPKRANWDIERDIAPMLKKLEKRTQHSIVEILRMYFACGQRTSGYIDVVLTVQVRKWQQNNRKKAMKTRRRTRKMLPNKCFLSAFDVSTGSA